MSEGYSFEVIDASGLDELGKRMLWLDTESMLLVDEECPTREKAERELLRRIGGKQNLGTYVECLKLEYQRVTRGA